MLQSFLTVVDAGSFQQASQRLGYAQPTISQHVKKLENDLGVLLVRRTSPKCVPTPEGLLLIPYARSMLRLGEMALTAVHQHRIYIGTSSNIGVYLLQPYLRRLKDSMEGESFKVEIETNHKILDKLDRGEVDVAILEWWDDRTGYEVRRWRNEKLVVIVSPDHPWADLSAVPIEKLHETVFLGGEPGTGTGRILRKTLNKMSNLLKISYCLGSTEAVKRAVRAGLGASIVLSSSVADETSTGTLCALPIEGHELTKTIYLAFHPATPRSSPVHAFVAMLLDAPAGKIK